MLNKTNNKQGESIMEKEKTYYWDKFNPIELFMWRNQSSLKRIIKSSYLGGSKVTGVKFDPTNQHITFTSSYYSRSQMYDKNNGWYKKEKKSYPYITVLASLKERKQLEADIISEENPMLKKFLEALKLTKEKERA